MSQKLYVAIPADLHADSVVSWVTADASRLAQGGLAELATAAVNHDVVVIVPGEEVLQTTVKVPGKNRQRVVQALPFALEEQLIDDVDDLHIALGRQLEEGSYQVAVIRRDKLQSCLNVLASAGIFPTQLLADYMLLPAAEGACLFIEKDRFLCQSNSCAFAASIDAFAALLPAAVKECNAISVIQTGDAGVTDIESVLPNHHIDKQQSTSSSLLWLVQHASQHQPINLLQGQFQRKKKMQQFWQPWYPVAALFVVWLVFEAGMAGFNYYRLSQQEAELQRQIETIYRGLYPNFPKERKVLDARSRIETDLKNLKSKGGQGGSSFTEMFTASATILHKTPGLLIKSLRYNEGRIDLEVQLSKLQDLDNLKAGLQQQAGWQVEIQNAASEKDFVTARLQIKGAGV